MSENAIVREIDNLPARYQEGHALAPSVDVQAIQAAKTAIFPKDGTDAEFHLFLAFCQRTGLDPLRKQVYAMKMQGKLTIMVGIDGIRTQAGRSGLYLGSTEPLYCGADGVWTDVWLKQEPPHACKVGVFRRGAPQPTYATILYSEFKIDTNPNWKQRPAHMLAIRAEAHALKKAFPAELQDFHHGEPEEFPAPAAGQTTITEEPVPMPHPRAVQALQAGEKDTYSESKGLPAPQERPEGADLKAIVQANLKQLGHPDPKKTLPYLAECLGTRLTSFKDLKEEDWPFLVGATTQAVKDKGACFAIWGKHNPIKGSKETADERAFRLTTWGAHLDEEIQSTAALTPAKWALLRDSLAQEFPDQPAADPFQDE